MDLPDDPTTNGDSQHAVRRSSGYAFSGPRFHKRTPTGFIPDGKASLKELFPGDEKTWRDAIEAIQPKNDNKSIETSIVRHIHNTLGRAPFNIDDTGAYLATALSVRERLIKYWDETQIFYTQVRPKRVYYFSIEFLLGKSLDNSLLNLSIKDNYEQSTSNLGFSLEDFFDGERDSGLGNGGLGRLAACYMDSLSTTNIPAWGYGLRYQYGIFQQMLNEKGEQVEAPDPWLEHAYPWEIPRLDSAITIKFYGSAQKATDGSNRGTWSGGTDVLAVPFDVPVPGYDTRNTNNIRLWASRPKRAFNFQSFNLGNYDQAVDEAEHAENITRVLYPNDNFEEGKELRFKQQYFWCAASLDDIVRRFKKLKIPWSEFPHLNAIQLNDTHPTISIVEFQRILVDEENIEWNDAWDIVEKTFGYTNHTVMTEALEKWPVTLIERLLPRHMQIIYDINFFFLQKVERRWPNDHEKLKRMSLIEEGSPKQVRMAYLATIGSHKVNGVAELHSNLVKDMLRDFVDFFGSDKFTNVTNGITPRRWLHQCNPCLSSLIRKTLGSDRYLHDLYELKNLEQFVDNTEFQDKFYQCKLNRKERLATYIEETTGQKIDKSALFDIQIKRIHEYKRQFMNVLGCVYRYLRLKKMSPEERAKQIKRVSVFAGKAAPGYFVAKQVIYLINSVSKVINNDPDFGDAFKVIFLPDYSVSLAEIIVPASDISEHISTAGMEGSGTSNMKFALNGGLILGTVDGANIEILEEVGDDQVFFFGHLSHEIPEIKHQNYYHGVKLVPELKEALDAIRSGTFSQRGTFDALLNTITEGGDQYCINADFQSYLKAQDLVDQVWLNNRQWIRRSIFTVARMGKFSSDRAVMEYADEIWSVDQVPVPNIE